MGPLRRRLARLETAARVGLVSPVILVCFVVRNGTEPRPVARPMAASNSRCYPTDEDACSEDEGASLGRSFLSDAPSPSAISNGRRTTMKEKEEAISGTVTGNDQHVGFRAMIMKQAIEYNLAGFTKNLPNDVVNFTLQGDAKRLTAAVSVIQEGSKKSSDITVSTTQVTFDPALNDFTIYAWTSTTRNITNPYNLVFHLRPDDGKLASADVKAAWHGILRSTLKGDDLKKLGPDD
jgi:acylphosphatase